jgi:hypothetical protein
VELLSHSFNFKALLMDTLKYSPSILLPIFTRIIISSISKKDKNLTIETTKRAIIFEDSENLPFSIKDEDGNSIYNCYCFVFRIWNKGGKDVRSQDISKSKPIILEIGSEARVLGQPFASRDDIGLNIFNLENGKFKVDFDFINSDEWVEIYFYVTGNPNARVSASGRIAGQNSPEFHVSIDDGRASLDERLSALLFIILIVSSPISFVTGFIWLLRILYDYPIQTLWLEPEHIPKSLIYSLIYGLMLPVVYLISFMSLRIARRNHPKNYHLEVDYPKPIQDFPSYWYVFWKGKRLLLSNSSYNYREILFLNQEDN